MQPADSPAPPSFAGLLAALATPAQATNSDRDDGLEDDIAELSYESALRPPARREGSPGSDPTKAWPAGGIDTDPAGTSVFPASESAGPAPGSAAGIGNESTDEAGSPPNEMHARKDRVTLRLSRSEVLRLRGRAAESGLTVSAYLRTCILEVESLRAQVKDALVRMRSTETQCEPQNAQRQTKLRPQAEHRWRERFFPRWKGSGRAECA
jgi:hypothetical protein